MSVEMGALARTRLGTRHCHDHKAWDVKPHTDLAGEDVQPLSLLNGTSSF